jgi:hypothetical protein
VLGLAGLVLFFFYELKIAANPMVSQDGSSERSSTNHYMQMPGVLVSNRTSLSGYIQTFIASIVSVGLVCVFSPNRLDDCMADI